MPKKKAFSKNRRLPKAKIYGVNNKQILHLAWAHALNWYLHSQPRRLRELGQGVAILSKSGKMAHAMLVGDQWILLSNPWFQAGIPDVIIDFIVNWIRSRTKKKSPVAVRDQAISFYRQVYLTTRNTINAAA